MLHDVIQERDEAREALAELRAYLGSEAEKDATICIPYYAQPQYLAQSLGSAVQQTAGLREVIVVDDGSPDSVARELCERHKAEGYPVRYVRVTNRGLPNARNTGLMLAQGYGFLPLDADDWIEPTFLEKTLPLLGEFDVVASGLQEHGPVRNGTYMPGTDRPIGEVTVEVQWQNNHMWYCHDPSSLVWMGDMTFKPIGDVQIGDEVIGWDVLPRADARASSRTKLVKTVVTAISERAHIPVVRIGLESGRELRCTPDHWWLGALYTKRDGPEIRQRKAGYAPTRVRGRDVYVMAQPGRLLVRVIDPVNAAGRATRSGGYLAGLYDGEGSGHAISQSEKKNPGVYRALREALSNLQISFTEHRNGRDDVKEVHIVGGRQGYVEFLNKVGPTKTALLERRILTAKYRTPDFVAQVAADGYSDVVSLETATGNYVVSGYASKNCSLYRTELLREIGGWNGRMVHGYEDWDAHIDLLKRGVRYGGYNEVLFHYSTRADSMLMQISGKMHRQIVAEMQRHHDGWSAV